MTVPVIIPNLPCGVYQARLDNINDQINDYAAYIAAQTQKDGSHENTAWQINRLHLLLAEYGNLHILARINSLQHPLADGPAEVATDDKDDKKEGKKEDKKKVADQKASTSAPKLTAAQKTGLSP